MKTQRPSKRAPRKETVPAKPKAGAKDKPKKPVDQGLLKAALTGSHEEILRAALEKLTNEAAAADARELPGLIREIRNVARELDKIPPAGENVVDKIKAARERRRAKAARR